MVLEVYQKSCKRGFKDILERFLEGSREFSEKSQQSSRDFQEVSKSFESISGSYFYNSLKDFS